MLVLSSTVISQEVGKDFKKFRDEIEKEFDEIQEKSKHEFETFVDTINKEYIKIILESEKEFSELLKESFREFKVMLADEFPGNTKPEQIPGYRLAPRVNTFPNINERRITLEEGKGILLTPAYEDTKSVGLRNKVTLKFLGSSFDIDFDNRIRQMPATNKINSEVVKSTYDFLRNVNYRITLEQFIEIVRQMNLNDWDYYCLVDEFCKSISDDPNMQKVIAWFLLMESNFRVKIGYFKDTSAVLFASSQTIYNTPWFNINGERYYAMGYRNDLINTYDIDYFKGYKYLNIFHDKPLLLEEVQKDIIITFLYKGVSYSIPLSYDMRYVDYFSKYPMTPIDFYFALPVSATFKESIEENIAPHLKNMDRSESIHFLLNLVQQGFMYQTDAEQFNREKYMVPEEMLYYNNSDCDDRTIMFSYLINELLHLNVIALDFNGHICSAVQVPDSEVKGNLIHNGIEYLVCDPTYTSAPPGIILPPFQVKDATIIDFNSNYNHYLVSRKTWENVFDKGLLQANNTHNISITGNGNIFLTGIMKTDKLSVDEKSDGNVENASAFIAHLDPVEEIQWLKRLIGSGPNFGYCISEVNEQFLYAFGYFEDTLILDGYRITSQEQGDFYLAKLDKSGKTYWLQKILVPADSLAKGITTVVDPNGNIKYYMPNDHFPYENNYLMQVDDKEFCYIYAMIPGKVSGVDKSKYLEFNGQFDLINYLIKSNDYLVKQNYPRSVSLLYTLIQYLTNYGSVIEGASLQKTIETVYYNMKSDLPARYSEIAKISEIINYNGVTWIKTINHQPVIINPLQAQHESRLKLSYINGNAKIDVLNGVRIGNNQVWNDLNYILLDKVTGKIIFSYDNQYRKKMPVHSQLL